MTTIGNLTSTSTYTPPNKIPTGPASAEFSEAAAASTTSKAGDVNGAVMSTLATLRQNALSSFLQTFLDALGDGKSGSGQSQSQDQTYIDGGEGDDEIHTIHNSIVDAGSGNDLVDAMSYSAVDGGDGDDTISVYDHSVVFGGTGNDSIRTYDFAYVDGGEGDDKIITDGNSTIYGGTGNDTVRAGENSYVEGGEGNDKIEAGVGSTVYGGDGDDLIRGGNYVNAGVGNDVIMGGATIIAGDGDDTIVGGKNIDAGAGNDVISVLSFHGSTISGGSGNDTIWVHGEQTVKFASGDGKDYIALDRSGSTLELGEGLTRDDIQISYSGNVATITFAGNNSDSITVEFGAYFTGNTTASNNPGGQEGKIVAAESLTVSFADGSTMTIEPETLGTEAEYQAFQQGSSKVLIRSHNLFT